MATLHDAWSSLDHGFTSVSHQIAHIEMTGPVMFGMVMAGGIFTLTGFALVQTMRRPGPDNEPAIYVRKRTTRPLLSPPKPRKPRLRALTNAAGFAATLTKIGFQTLSSGALMGLRQFRVARRAARRALAVGAASLAARLAQT